MKSFKDTCPIKKIDISITQKSNIRDDLPIKLFQECSGNYTIRGGVKILYPCKDRHKLECLENKKY